MDQLAVVLIVSCPGGVLFHWHFAVVTVVRKCSIFHSLSL